MSYWIAGATVVSAASSADASRSSGITSLNMSRDARRAQQGQFDIQRQDRKPWMWAGQRAVGALEDELREGDYTPAQFDYQGAMPEGEPLPEFQGGDRFQFDLEADPGYQFARDEAIKSTNREMTAGGKYGSGNRLAEIADRVTGVASQYAQDAYGRQMGTSRENYGRGLSEYGLDYGRSADMYGRDVSREASQYGRGLTGYGLDRERQQDIYGQQQNYLNRLSSVAGLGQTAVSGSAAAGSNMANAMGNIYMQDAANQTNAAVMRNQGLNQAVQGGISNYMLQDYLGSQPGTGYGGTNVQGDANQPSQNYYAR